MLFLTARLRGFLRRAILKMRRVGMPIPLRLLIGTPAASFDPNWYLQAYPDVMESRQNPVEHYLLHGRADGRSPNEEIWRLRELASEAFDRNWYLRRYPDVARQGVDPVMHYLTYGRQEGRSPTIAHARSMAWVQSFGEH